MKAMATFAPAHFLWRMDGDVAVIQLNRPDRKNPLTFDSYAELRDTFRALPYADDVNAVVFLPNGGNFCSGGDVHDIIGPLVAMEMKELLAFTRMTGDLVKAMLGCGKPVIAAIDGIAVGAGAIIAMAADLRLATPEAKTAFLFTRVGLAGCDMGACAMLPRLIGQGRAAELLYTGRAMTAQEGERWGFFNKLVDAGCARAGGDGARPSAHRRPDLRPRHHQDAAQSGMVDEPRAGNRGGSAGAGDLHADEGFRARLPRVCRQGAAEVRGQLMADKSFLGWPFFDERHRALACAIDDWCASHLPVDHHDVDAACRELVAMLGRDGWLVHSAIDPDAPGALDVRTLCLMRETLARHDGLADFAFAMQGLGAGAISLFGSAAQRQMAAADPRGPGHRGVCALGAAVGLGCRRHRHDGDTCRQRLCAQRREDLDIEWRHCRLLRRLCPHRRGTRRERHFGVSGTRGEPGFSIAERIEVIAPHPLARLRFENAHVPADAMIGAPGEGFKIAMATLDVFRTTVGAAALGFARRALDEATGRARARKLFGAPLADLQMVQGSIAEMALDVDAAALLVYRAAWAKDTGAARVTREAAMAKLFATERAQDVIDKAVQIHGGDGVRHGHIVESLYRDIRALRIYEGASEVQKVIIARQALSAG